MFPDIQNVNKMFFALWYIWTIYCNCKHKFCWKSYKCFAKPYDTNINTKSTFLITWLMCFELKVFLYLSIYIFNELELSTCTCWKSAMHAGRKSHWETRAHSTVPAGLCLQYSSSASRMRSHRCAAVPGRETRGHWGENV